MTIFAKKTYKTYCQWAKEAHRHNMEKYGEEKDSFKNNKRTVKCLTTSYQFWTSKMSHKLSILIFTDNIHENDIKIVKINTPSFFILTRVYELAELYLDSQFFSFLCMSIKKRGEVAVEQITECKHLFSLDWVCWKSCARVRLVTRHLLWRWSFNQHVKFRFLIHLNVWLSHNK